jgi:hypothetical protein
MTSKAIFCIALLLLAGCGAMQPARPPAAPQRLALTYRATGGRLPVDLDLRLHDTGQAELFIGTSYAIPLERVNRVGAFAGAAPAAQIDALREYITRHNLLARGGSHGALDPDSPARQVTIIADGRQVDMSLNGMSADPIFDGFEQLLQQLALTLTQQPTQAVEATLDLSRTGDTVTTAIVLRAIGTQPFTALFLDPAQPTPALRAQVEIAGQQPLPSGASMPIPVGSATLSAAAVSEQAKAGQIPSGVVHMPVDTTYTFALPSIDIGQATLPLSATGTLRFLLPARQAQRELVLLTRDVSAP